MPTLAAAAAAEDLGVEFRHVCHSTRIETLITDRSRWSWLIVQVGRRPRLTRRSRGRGGMRRRLNLQGRVSDLLLDNESAQGRHIH